jgi:hypothetical protein
MSSLRITGLSLFLVMVAGCSVEFNPDSNENREQLVVEGMITDQNRINRIRLSKSCPLGNLLHLKL